MESTLEFKNKTHRSGFCRKLAGARIESMDDIEVIVEIATDLLSEHYENCSDADLIEECFDHEIDPEELL